MHQLDNRKFVSTKTVRVRVRNLSSPSSARCRPVASRAAKADCLGVPFSLTYSLWRVFVAQHTSHEHYVKVVGSQFWFADGSVVRTNKYSVNSHAYTSESTVAHAKFQYDLSPMTVVVRESRVPLYRFITSLCAIVGGAYTVMSLFDSFVDAGVNSLKKKVELGKAS